jgi:hypothetical protein
VVNERERLRESEAKREVREAYLKGLMGQREAERISRRANKEL